MLGLRATQTPQTSCDGPGRLALSSLTRLTFMMPDGTEYELRDAIYDGKPYVYGTGWGDPCTGQNVPPNGLDRGRVFLSRDGSQLQFFADSDVYDTTSPISTGFPAPSGNLMFPDGTLYRIDSYSNGQLPLVTYIRDRNGNR